jgi:DNA-binding beta-propeller fold protein YncE
VYVANYSSNNITVIDGATNAITTVADPHALGPVALAIDSVTNKIYLVNQLSNNVTVLDGATLTATTVTDPSAVGPASVAINSITNRIYIPNTGSNNITEISGATNKTLTLTGPNAGSPVSVAINAVTNKIYVSNQLTSNVTVIDGITHSVTTVTDFSAFEPLGVVVNPVTGKVYVANPLSNNVTVITEQQVHRTAFQTKIQPLPGGRTNNPTPTFGFTAIDPLAKVDNLLFQVDTWQGPWMTATNEGLGQFKGKIQRPLELGEHILYAYETDGQEATSTNTGAQSSPMISNITAYIFLAY